jgi:hypothetical protein
MVKWGKAICGTKPVFFNALFEWKLLLCCCVVVVVVVVVVVLCFVCVNKSEKLRLNLSGS